jgi:hypothetical protein
LSGDLWGWSNLRSPAVVFLIASWFRPVIPLRSNQAVAWVWKFRLRSSEKISAK